ncbi:MAG: phosphopantothenate/pantothenate synthetase family protein, partial [Candidatus Bathyarchaeota archaeon]|nr:phosphopantothenate/pantothenate synthetase family protein [Candidatus Bathyarchaeota archaeon]
LEDGDRTEALVKMGKTVLAVDLNPLSRTAQKASITIVDNIVRTMPRIVEAARKIGRDVELCRQILSEFDNKKNLNESLLLIANRLTKIATQAGSSAPVGDKT